MPVAVPGRSTGDHGLLPAPGASCWPARAISRERGERLGSLGRVGRESVRFPRQGQASPAKTRRPGNACCHKGGTTWAPTAPAAVAGARVFWRTAYHLPAGRLLPGRRPVQQRLAPDFEGDSRLSLTTSLQYVHATRTCVLPDADRLQRNSHTPEAGRSCPPHLLNSRRFPLSLFYLEPGP